MTESQRWLIAIAVMLATVLEIVDGTIVSIALPHMMGTFGATTDQITWILTSYIVSSAIVMPLSGFLMTRLGSKKLLIINIAGFLITSMMCGAATTLSEIVMFRILQGVFGASLMPLSQFILRNTFPPEQLTKAMAIWGVGIMAGPVLGPTIGGYITESFNWRWIFYVNAPICIIDILMCLKFVPETATRKVKTDVWGIVLLITCIACLQVFLDRGNTVNWFEAKSTWWLFSIFCISFIYFIYHGTTHAQAIINLKIFVNRNFSLGCLMMALFAGAVIGVVSIQPLFLENLMNYPPDFAGVVMAPRGITSAIAMALVPLLVKRWDARLIVIAGIFICGISTYLLSKITLEAGSLPFIIIGAIQGIGMGLFFVPLAGMTFATLAESHAAEATGIFSFCRNLGTSISISLLGTLLTRENQINWNSMHGNINPFNTALQYHAVPLTELFRELSKQASAISFLDAYYAVTVAFFLMLPLPFLFSMRKNK